MARAEDAGEGAVEPALRRASAFAGPGVLRPEHLQAMRRVLERELPDRVLPAPPPPALELPARGRVAEPLPVWTPPPVVAPPEREECPSCGEAGEIVRVDLTVNAGWFHCQVCGRRWGGAIARDGGQNTAPTGDGRERGHVAAG